MRLKIVASLLMVCSVFIACNQNEVTLSGLNRPDFQKEIDGQLTDLFVLKNKKGMEVCITNYGGRVVSIMVPDRNGKLEDVVCGYASIQDYLDKKQNFGATIGRYIGRIRDAHFTLDSVEYKLMANKDTHCAHGGEPSFASRIWQAEMLADNTLKLSYLSPDGENGFPGNLDIHIIYTVTENNELDIRYEAETDAPTVINIGHHSFFNISGNLNSTIENQLLYVNANHFTPYDSTKCVTGEIWDVADTPLDFNTPTVIGKRIDDDYEQLKIVGGYDHSWILNTEGDDTRLAAKVSDPVSGRTLEVYTTEPALQIYTANGLKGQQQGKNGIAYPKRGAICLESMHLQDSPNQPQFPSTVLRPGDTFISHTVYRFGVE